MIDQGLRVAHPKREHDYYFAYGGDFGDTINDAQFCINVSIKRPLDLRISFFICISRRQAIILAHNTGNVQSGPRAPPRCYRDQVPPATGMVFISGERRFHGEQSASSCCCQCLVGSVRDLTGIESLLFP